MDLRESADDVQFGLGQGEKKTGCMFLKAYIA